LLSEWSLVKAEEMLRTFAATENGSVNVAAQQLGGSSNSWEFRFDAGWLIGTNSGEGGLHAILRLQQQSTPFINDSIQAAATTAVATAVTIQHLIDFGVLFLRQSFLAWCIAWFATLPIAVVAAPIIKGFVSVLSAPGASRH
jgi:hypothetical protein